MDLEKARSLATKVARASARGQEHKFLLNPFDSSTSSTERTTG
jgi:hypothetical protein